MLKVFFVHVVRAVVPLMHEQQSTEFFFTRPSNGFLLRYFPWFLECISGLTFGKAVFLAHGVCAAVTLVAPAWRMPLAGFPLVFPTGITGFPRVSMPVAYYWGWGLCMFASRCWLLCIILTFSRVSQVPCTVY